MAVVIRPHFLFGIKGVIMMINSFLSLFKKIVENVVARSIYDWLKSLFKDND